MMMHIVASSVAMNYRRIWADISRYPFLLPAQKKLFDIVVTSLYRAVVTPCLITFFVGQYHYYRGCRFPHKKMPSNFLCVHLVLNNFINWYNKFKEVKGRSEHYIYNAPH